MTRIIAFLSAILLATSAGAASTTSTNVDIIVTHAGSPVQTLIPMIQQSGTVFQFLAGTGSANRSLGTLIGAAIFPPTPAFAGTYSIGGPDAGKFTINSGTGAMSVGGSDIPCSPSPCNFSVMITVSQPGVIGSPASTTVNLQGVDPSDTSTLFLASDNYYPAPGSTIHVTVRNTPNTMGTDYLFMGPVGRSYFNCDFQRVAPGCQPYVGSAGTHDAVIPLPVPSPPTDNYQFLRVVLTPNNGQTSSATITAPDVLVTPSQAFVMPAAANTLAPPFTPSKTLTVCPSGCGFTLLSAALIAESNGNHAGTDDNVLITMQSGAYADCQAFGNNSPFTAPTDDRLWHIPPHLWIEGIGGGFAHLEARDDPSLLCEGKGVMVWWGLPTDILYLDNLEISDWNPGDSSVPSGIYVGTGSVTQRNTYIHDGANCMVTGNNTPASANFTLQNVHYARCGGSTGPEHLVYIGDQALSSTLDHSLMEQSDYGHDVKTRAYAATFTCNIAKVAQDDYFVGSETFNCAEGRTCNVRNNTLVVGKPPTVVQPQQEMAGWATDFESGLIPGPTWSLVLSNNILISDSPARVLWGWYIGPPPNGSASIMTSPPDTWTNNTFVGLSYPFGSYHSTGGAGGAAGYPDPSQVTEVGDHLYATRAAWVAAGGSSQTFPSPPGCAGTIGNMAVP